MTNGWQAVQAHHVSPQTDVQVLLDFKVPVTDVLPSPTYYHLDELWGSIFSYDGGKFLWKKPRHWPYPVSISFGTPIHGVNDVDVVRHGVLELAAKSMERRKDRRLLPANQFIRQCRVAWRRTKVADSAGVELTGGRLLTGSLAFHKLLTEGHSRVRENSELASATGGGTNSDESGYRKNTSLKPDAQYVGLLLPPSVGGVLANAAISLAGKVAVNLNYTLTDEEGFIRITGRQSRFSKIGGEMVPHIRIEQEIARIIEDKPSDEAEIICAVTAVPDSTKGERLIVLHKPMQRPVREIMDRLQKAGLPNLWIPSSDSFMEVNQIPLLGTGKLDLRGIKDMAMNHYFRETQR